MRCCPKYSVAIYAKYSALPLKQSSFFHCFVNLRSGVYFFRGGKKVRLITGYCFVCCFLDFYYDEQFLFQLFVCFCMFCCDSKQHKYIIN